MIRYAGFVLARLVVVVFCLLTAAYATLNCSPFAFDMFIRPQLIPGVATFVAWHHLLYWGAYALGVVTLAGELLPRQGRTRRETIARGLAIAYVVVLGLVGAMLVANPFLPRLWNDSRALPTALVAFVPLGWLALIDHLASREVSESNAAGRARDGGQHRLLMTCTCVALYVWVAHMVRALSRNEWAGHGALLSLTGLWALALTLGAFAAVYTLATLTRAFAARARQPERWTRLLTVGIATVAMGEFLRRFAFPTISLSGRDAAWVSAIAAVCLTTTVSGVVLRHPATWKEDEAAGPRRWLPAAWPATGVALLLLAVSTSFALSRIEQLDWAFLAQRTILVAEALGACLLIRRITAKAADRPWTITRAVVPPVAALAALLGVPYCALAAASVTGDRTLEPASAFDTAVAAEPVFKFMSDVLVTRAGFDSEYLRVLQLDSNMAARRITVPDIDFAATPSAPGTRRLDIFVFVIDSLRRDYLSPYNPAVTFTPNIGRLAGESAVFRNAFTRHGGTLLAAPSIWAGAATIKTILAPGFERMNAFEKFVNENGYRMAVNDFTVAPLLRASTPVTTIDPGVPSIDTDLCRNLESLEAHLDATNSDPRPVFAYLSPMNLHVLNTRRGGQQPSEANYAGFYAPYASRLRRMDGCLGTFVSYLQQRGRYDRSIVLLTSDHGDSLGEDGRWGHGTWLSPEVVRVPFLVRLPPPLQASLTTDLARLAFTADIAPTLYALAGHPVRNLGPPFGEPLFVASGRTLSDRSRDSFLLTSSYGASYGLLRHNGRELYVTDLIARRDFAYDLSHAPLGGAVPITAQLRRVNERGIRDAVTKTQAFYKVKTRQP